MDKDDSKKPVEIKAKIIAPDNIRIEPDDLAAATKEISNSVAKALGVNVLSQSVYEAVKLSTEKTLQSRTKTIIQQETDQKVKEILSKGIDPLSRISTRLGDASKGLTHITQNPDVDKVLQETAKLLFKKFSFLKAAGFTDQQAFDLVKAELESQSGRPR